MGAVPLPAPRPRGESPLPGPLPLLLPGDPPLLLSVLDVGLACCAVELMAAAGLSAGTGDEPAVRVLVVAGTVTDKVLPDVLAAHARAAADGPVRVMSFGACASTGGPYWDSYCVTKGIDQVLKVDVYVPGCPPRPAALLQGLRLLQQAPGRAAG